LIKIAHFPAAKPGIAAHPGPRGGPWGKLPGGSATAVVRAVAGGRVHDPGTLKDRTSPRALAARKRGGALRDGAAHCSLPPGGSD
jgi:hypothetical protein